MTVSFTTTRRDILALAASTYLRSPWTYALLAAFMVATLPGTVSALDPDLGLAVLIITAAMMQVMLVAGLVPILVVVAVLSVLISGRKSLEQRSMTFDGDSLMEQTSTSSTVVSWSGIHKVVRSRNYIFVYVKPLAGYPIPRRAVGSDQEWESLGAFIQDAAALART